MGIEIDEKQAGPPQNCDFNLGRRFGERLPMYHVMELVDDLPLSLLADLVLLLLFASTY